MPARSSNASSARSCARNAPLWPAPISRFSPPAGRGRPKRSLPQNRTRPRCSSVHCPLHGCANVVTCVDEVGAVAGVVGASSARAFGWKCRNILHLRFCQVLKGGDQSPGPRLRGVSPPSPTTSTRSQRMFAVTRWARASRVPPTTFTTLTRALSSPSTMAALQGVLRRSSPCRPRDSWAVSGR